MKRNAKSNQEFPEGSEKSKKLNFNSKNGINSAANWSLPGRNIESGGKEEERANRLLGTVGTNQSGFIK